MIIAIIVLTGLVAFGAGFMLGLAPIKETANLKKGSIDIEAATLAEEYRNFLNYDGSEQ